MQNNNDRALITRHCAEEKTYRYNYVTKIIKSIYSYLYADCNAMLKKNGKHSVLRVTHSNESPRRTALLLAENRPLISTVNCYHSALQLHMTSLRSVSETFATEQKIQLVGTLVIYF